MDLSPTNEQEFLREAVRGAIDREAPLARVREWVAGETPEHAADHGPAAALAERQGWTGIGIDEDDGGQGGGTLELAILAEELGRGAVPADALYARLLAAQVLPGRDLVLARPGDRPLDAEADGDRLALVAGAAPGAQLLSWNGIHDAGEVTPRVMLDRTRQVADVTLGPVAEAHETDARTRRLVAATGAVLIAADALGAAQRLLDLTTEYVGQRVQFGVAVGSFQAVKHTAAQMLVAIEGTRAALQYAAWAVGADEPGAAVDAWVAKSRAARAAVDVADKALFLHGAVGYTWEHDLQLLFKRCKSDAQLWGGPGAYDDRIADSLELA